MFGREAPGELIEIAETGEVGVDAVLKVAQLPLIPVPAESEGFRTEASKKDRIINDGLKYSHCVI